MKIENINIGICHARVQQGKPAFFVNWIEDSKNKYKFFELRFICENFKNRLVKLQNNNLGELKS